MFFPKAQRIRGQAKLFLYTSTSDFLDGYMKINISEMNESNHCPNAISS
jgi:hypothetical protein